MNTSTFFDAFFQNARINAIIIINEKGNIEKVSAAFTATFGYTLEDLAGKSFAVLFTEKARQDNKPEIEIQNCLRTGSGSDENYIVAKDGTLLWVSGESVCTKDADGNVYFLKVIQNIQVKKQLERFLMEAYDFIDSIFDSVDNTAFLIVDSRLKVIKSNRYFNTLFGLKESPAEGIRISEIANPLWKQDDLRHDIINCLVTNNIMRNSEFDVVVNNESIPINVSARILEKRLDEKDILIIVTKR